MSFKKYVLSIDQGTSSSRACLFDKKGRLVAMTQKSLKQIYPKPGWVEMDAMVIWKSVKACINELLSNEKIDSDSIASIGIANQRETTVIWDKYTGIPIHNAVVWQSRQSEEYVSYLEEKDVFDKIKSKTGLMLNSYFSATKITWLLDNHRKNQVVKDYSNLLFGTIDTWLIWKLTKGQAHVTDVSNASRTMLFNIDTLKWDDELCNIMNIPKSILPVVKQSSDSFGKTDLFGSSMPITGVAGDQQGVLIGEMCTSVGDVKCTYGTGCFLLMNTGLKRLKSSNGLLTTIAWSIEDEVTYALEGSVLIGGSAIQWLRDEVKLIDDMSESETAALNCTDEGSLYVIPAFVGLGTPYWDVNVRGAMFGLTRDTTDQHIIKATLEAIAYQVNDVVEVMKKTSQLSISSLRVDGGMTQNAYLMQFQSDVCDSTLDLPSIAETTALGAAYLAGLYTGFYESIKAIQSHWKKETSYTSKMGDDKRMKLINGWRDAVSCARQFRPH
jgi:glycerol kinase